MRLGIRKYANNPQRGATTVEFSVIAALLLLILFGIIEYALLFMQEHYVTNAAREAVRIGVRANNYDLYNSVALPTAGPEPHVADRLIIVRNAAADYLNTFYDEDKVRNGTSMRMFDKDEDLSTESDRALVVTIEVENLFTNITPGLLSYFGSGASTKSPSKISASAQMELEDQEEFDPDRGQAY